MRRPSRAAWLLSGLYRPLAADERREDYWLRHVNLGIVLSEIAAVSVLVYAYVNPDLHAETLPMFVGAALLVMVGTPALRLLPLRRMTRDVRGPLLFYCWSLADTAVVTVLSRLDGGDASPLSALLFLTLAFMAVAYPPAGVFLTGAVMTATYLLVICAPHPDLHSAFLGVVMASFTLTCAIASSNQWTAYDEQVQLLAREQVLASTDPLTGCLNRRAFLDRVAAAVAGTGSEQQAVLCLIDLDGFKAINDTCGHASGDEVLREVSGAVSTQLRSTDAVARLGGDEFAVLAEVDGPGCAVAVADRVRAAVAEVGRSRGVTASVGVTEVRTGDDLERLLGRADTAMYAAKRSGGDRVSALAA